MIGICVVERTGKFTLLDDYEISNTTNTVISNDGYVWYLHDQGDGYVGCSDERGNEILSFLLE